MMLLREVREEASKIDNFRSRVYHRNAPVARSAKRHSTIWNIRVKHFALQAMKVKAREQLSTGVWVGAEDM